LPADLHRSNVFRDLEGGALAVRVRNVVAVTCITVLAVAGSAQATFPGKNGRIAFERNGAGGITTMNADGTGISATNWGGYSPAWSPDGQRIAFGNVDNDSGEIYVMNADGGEVANLTNDRSTAECCPSWSPDGSKIAFLSDRASPRTYGIYVMNVDGTNVTRLTQFPSGITPLGVSWSPDGTKFAFTRNDCPSCGSQTRNVYTMNVDGSGLTKLTNATAQDAYYSRPDWSPDGRQIVFEEKTEFGGYVNLWVMNADGTGKRQLTDNSSTGHDPGATDTRPSWSPDGTKIVFAHDYAGWSIRTINPDGTGQTVLTAGAVDFNPSWQPIPVNHVRPRGASPLHVSLVPAYMQCASANDTHGAPIAFSSCNPPQQVSSYLTIGTPDANGSAANSSGSVVYTVVSGNASTPANEADLKIDVNISGVLNRSGLSPYSGELSADAALRITDKDNTPSPGGPGSATVQDSSFVVTVPCNASTCALATAANALAPGVALEGRRSVWELGQVKIYDGGADGLASTTGDNTLFMDEGIFVP
jgi:TolB protein